MKYGETLHQRSPPEWGAYNVDYNEIKAIIKHHTTGVKAAAITIPGQTFHDAAFEDELYRELVEQHTRVDLFVRSKSGEIKRRLEHLEKIALHLRNTTKVGEKKRIPVRRLERFSRLETDTLRTGDEIQALARYIGAQKLAFKKLLKKYRKWTGASQLAVRFEKSVVNKPRAFESQQLDQLLLQYNELLAAVRAPFEADGTWRGLQAELGPSLPVRNPSLRSSDGSQTNPADGLHHFFNDGLDLEFDAAFGGLPLGPSAGHVAFWIHNDNLIQLHILLLQYMRLRPGSSVSATPVEDSNPSPSPRGSVDSSFGGKEISGQIVCDELAAFAKGRSGMTIDQLEAQTGLRPEDAAATVHYTSAGECLVSVTPDVSEGSKDSAKRNRIAMRCKYKQKELQPLFQAPPKSDSATIDASTESDTQNASLSLRSDEVRSWFASHCKVQPLVHLQYRRGRFGGVSNNEKHGVWATLDRNVKMKSASAEDFEMPSGSHAFNLFPHALLEIRWEGEAYPELVKQLESSHLTERVPGFSLQVHAVSVLCDLDLPSPYWLSILDRDIRKIPNDAPKSGRRRASLSTAQGETSSGRPSTGTASITEQPSSSGFSKPQVHSSATSVQDIVLPPAASKKQNSRRKSRKSRYPGPQQQQQQQQQKEQRYWNEFDNGEEAEQDETYTLLVDPNTSTPFVDGWDTLASRGKRVAQSLWSHLSRQEKNNSKSSERSPLLPTDYFSVPAAPESPTGSEDAGSDPTSPDGQRPKLRTNYSTFPTFHSLADPLEPLSLHTLEQRDSFLVRSSIVAFLVSFALTLMAGLLEFTRRRSYVVAADVGIVFGAVVSMVSAVAAVGLSSARQLDVGWMGKTQAALAFAVICMGNGVLIVILASG